MKQQYNRFIRPYLRRYRRSILPAILFASLTIIASAILTFTSGYLISRASLQPENILLLYIPIVLVRASGLGRAVFQYFERLTGHNAVLRILGQMRVRLYQMLEEQALLLHSRFKTGDLLGTLADDIEHLQDVYIRTVFPMISALVIFALTTISLTVFDWKFALFIACCMAIMLYVYPLWSLYFYKKQQIKQKKWHTSLYQSLTDAVFGVRDWLISRKEHRFITNFSQGIQKKHDLEKQIEHWDHRRSFQLQMLSGIILIIVAFWSSNMAQQGIIAPSYIAAFTLVTLPILESMIPMSRAVERIPVYQESMHRLEEIEQFLPPKKAVHNQSIPIDSNLGIELQHVSFRYPGQQQDALHDVSLSIPQGKKLAILGRSGAGKTTLLNLLLGELLPTSGSVSIQGASPSSYGENIYQMISLLNQKPYLFATTVENNIRLGNPLATTEEIKQAIQQVKLDQYISSLPLGLKTEMEETGQRFSGGERQRIALARILLKNTPIVILDEPTIGLDPQTEAALLETIFTVLAGKTIIWITHHLIGMEQMDEIIFMDHGKVMMRGSHKELMKSNKRYQNLYRMDHGLG